MNNESPIFFYNHYANIPTCTSRIPVVGEVNDPVDDKVNEKLSPLADERAGPGGDDRIEEASNEGEAKPECL